MFLAGGWIVERPTANVLHTQRNCPELLFFQSVKVQQIWPLLFLRLNCAGQGTPVPVPGSHPPAPATTSDRFFPWQLKGENSAPQTKLEACIPAAGLADGCASVSRLRIRLD